MGGLDVSIDPWDISAYKVNETAERVRYRVTGEFTVTIKDYYTFNSPVNAAKVWLEPGWGPFGLLPSGKHFKAVADAVTWTSTKIFTAGFSQDYKIQAKRNYVIYYEVSIPKNN